MHVLLDLQLSAILLLIIINNFCFRESRTKSLKFRWRDGARARARGRQGRGELWRSLRHTKTKYRRRSAALRRSWTRQRRCMLVCSPFLHNPLCRANSQVHYSKPSKLPSLLAASSPHQMQNRACTTFPPYHRDEPSRSRV